MTRPLPGWPELGCAVARRLDAARLRAAQSAGPPPAGPDTSRLTLSLAGLSDEELDALAAPLELAGFEVLFRWTAIVAARRARQILARYPAPALPRGTP